MVGSVEFTSGFSVGVTLIAVTTFLKAIQKSRPEDLDSIKGLAKDMDDVVERLVKEFANPIRVAVGCDPQDPHAVGEE